MAEPRVAFVTNLSPYYRRPLFESLAEELDATFYFFGGYEKYLGRELDHNPGSVEVVELRRIMIGGQAILPALWSELTRAKYDVVVKCVNGRLMLPYVAGIARLRSLPFVLWTGLWHHPQTYAHRLTRPLVESLYRSSDAIVTYGDHVKGFVERDRGVDPRKVFVAGQALDTSAFSAMEPAFGEPVEFLFVGRVEEEKGIRDLFAAFERIRTPDVRLRIAGAGPLEAEVRARATLDSRVVVLGHVPREQLPAEVARARCLVLPSITTKRFREPWGFVVSEAMAAGVPVIATDAVGAAAGGLVRNGENGLVVPERNPPELAAAMEALAADPDLARRFGAQARRDVSAFSYPRMVEAFTGAIDYAIAAQRARKFPEH